jgi:hypothetical protein
MVVDKAAIAVRLLVGVPNGWQAKVCEVATEFPEILLTQQSTAMSYSWSGCIAWRTDIAQSTLPHKSEQYCTDLKSEARLT